MKNFAILTPEKEEAYINETISALTKLAEQQIKIVQALGLIEALKGDEDGYDGFRRIYETHGNYIHPFQIQCISIAEVKARKLLYSNMSVIAEKVFREMLEEFYLKDIIIDDETKGNLYRHSYSMGHSNGFNEIHSEYMDIVEEFKTKTPDELWDILDI